MEAAFGGPRADPDTVLCLLGLDICTPYDAEFSGADDGRPAHTVARWVSSKGEKGHWSETLAAKLVPLLGDRSPSVRLASLEALGNLKSSAVLDKIIELLDDPEESVQKRAFHVLGTITGKQMGETFPEDENGRRFLIARWRAWHGRTLGSARPEMLQPSG
jgi:hypothetical protein